MTDDEAVDQYSAKLKSREWRLDNLYTIKDKDGKVVRFKRNVAQMTYWNALWYTNVILKARQLGFSTFIEMLMFDACLFGANTSAGIIDLTLDDARAKLEKIKFAYERLPPLIQNLKPAKRLGADELLFENGSSIGVGTSHRGGTLQHLHVSEFGKIAAKYPDKAKEIRTGAFGTVHAGQWIHVESTAEGSGGDFYDMTQRAQAMQQKGATLSKLDFKFHFFAWWQHPDYRLDPTTVLIPSGLLGYFEELRLKHRIELNAWQCAWYTAQQNRMGPDEMFREYPSIPEEAFFSSLEGAYFKRQMTQMRVDKRIGTNLFDPARKVNTFWDIGRDTTSIWWHQSDGVRNRLIDYYANSGESIAFYVKLLEDKRKERGFTYGKHLGPHDMEVTDWGGDGKTRKERAAALGLEFEVVPRVDNKADAIEEDRIFLGTCWIDEKYCEPGINCLDSYSKKWNEVLATWSNEPLHNWASHGADSLMTGACGFSPDPDLRPAIDRHRRGPTPTPRTAWGV